MTQYAIVRRRSILTDRGFRALPRGCKKPKPTGANIICWDRQEDAEEHLFSNLPALKDSRVITLVLGDGITVTPATE